MDDTKGSSDSAFVNVPNANTNDIVVSGPYGDIQVELSIIVGRTRPTIAELTSLREDSILLLDSEISDPVSVFVGDKLIARGELQDTAGDGKSVLSVKITELLSK
jgi:flagellar motor switch protein FliN